MQTRPDHPTLLEAVAEFLMSEIGPKLEQDKALQFRVLIAANLTNIVAQELRTQDARLNSEASRLAKLLPDQALAKTTDQLEALNRILATKLRDGSIDLQHAADHLMETAKETLAVTNPRFEVNP